MPVDGTYQPGTYRRQGGNEWVIGLAGKVVLDEGGELPRILRARVAVAAINAGAPLLAAVPGKKYRLHDAHAIAVGGAVTTVTTVDLIGTVSTARKLVAFGQAALTQSALVRAGAAGGVLLADGASFTQNDANTAITVGITGSSITVATHVDFAITYTLED
jgi:hypothetical protein